jgi:cation:H+ antiporter
VTILLYLAGGLACLLIGGEALVRGASGLAAALDVAPLVIGLTVVAYGTSAPEFMVSLVSSLQGNSDMALGNVVGSNTFNVLFILGVSALLTPLAVARQLVKVDVPIMIGLSLLLLVMAGNGVIGRFEGLGLLTLCGLYTWFAVWFSRRSGDPAVPVEGVGGPDRPPVGRNLLWIVLGLALLVLGSRFFVRGAVDLARAAGVSDLVIGLTIVAAGTSLPEVVTSVVAAMRGERDIAVGNVVGSNIFNILGVLGAAATASPWGGITVAESALQTDLPVMLLVAAACLPIFLTGYRVGRREGALFLGYYACYVFYLVLQARDHPGLEEFRTFLTWAIPLTGAALAWAVVRSNRQPA